MDAGVRADNMIDELTIDFEGADRYVKRLELFPSAHFAYDAGNGNTISAGYSYRTNRAGVWKLEPYITYKDYYTRLTGNPDLAPEYIQYGLTLMEKPSTALSGFSLEMNVVTTVLLPLWHVPSNGTVCSIRCFLPS